jgi:hypothetical protein
MIDVLETMRPVELDGFVTTKSIKETLSVVLSSPQRFKVYLIHGPSGIGKTTFARIFATKLGVDLSSESDYMEFNCGDDRGIDFVREFLSIIKSKSLFDGNRVIVLDEAHMLTSQAQNALLKGLEGLPADNYVIICSTNMDGLINTVKTRCYTIDLTPESLDDKEFGERLFTYGRSIVVQSEPKILELRKEAELNKMVSIMISEFLKRFTVDTFSLRQFAICMATATDTLSTSGQLIYEDIMQKAIKLSTDKYDPILVARWLIKQNFADSFKEEHWKQVAEKLSNLNCGIESARLMMLSYFGKILSSTNDEGERMLCFNTMKILLFDGTSSDAKAKMLLAFRDMFNKKGEMSSRYV